MKLPQLLPKGKRSWLLLALRWAIMLMMCIWGVSCMIGMPGRSYSGPFEPLSSHEQVISTNLEAHVTMLADTIGERSLWDIKGLRAAEKYIRDEFTKYGYEVLSQKYECRSNTVENIEARLKGNSLADEILVIGAHYDSVMACVAANDNGSGVAALLEIARLLAAKQLKRSVYFVAFVNEEPPFFQTGEMGSLVYAAAARQRDDNIIGMLSLETLGYYSDEPGSQHYPRPFSYFYPDTGNFIGFVGNFASRRFVQRTIGTFRDNAKFPSEGIAAPGAIAGIGWSDHWSFWKQGYPALMVTDTAPFRYPHYHAASDTPDKLVYDRMSRVVAGLTNVVIELAGGE